ncbi:MAG: S8 family serine peptidase [Firmicutes bacterium]|nr:S8 family serine peptidase [Bacillota bacterium]
MKQRSLISALICLCLIFGHLPAALAEETPEPVKVAFIDTGISTKHLDPAHVGQGKNYVFPGSDTQDRIGHGSATAGILLGSEDQQVLGLCPEAVAVPLVVVDLYPSGTEKNGGSEALCSAIRDAVDEFGCRIINISLASLEDTEELRAAVAYASEQGAVIISAAGNDGPEGALCYPSSYADVISVGTGNGKETADFSQKGAFIVTDGINIKVATNRNSETADRVSGTSYSCAIISAICAKMLFAYPEMTAEELARALKYFAQDILEQGFDALSGWGYVPGDVEITTPFLDVPAGAEYSEAVDLVRQQGIMEGVGGGMFAPERILSRGMIVTMLWRLEGCPEADFEMTFDDVPEGAWYYDAVKWAASEGIVEGYSPLHFRPENKLILDHTRLILERWAARGTDPDAPDDPESGEPSETGEPVITIPDGVFDGDPYAQVSRAEAAEILYKILGE